MKNLTISKALAYANKYYDEKGLQWDDLPGT